MKDHILIVQHVVTGKFHAELWIDHPKPSGAERAILKYSTNVGQDTEQAALDLMLKNLPADYVATIDVPDLKGTGNG